MNITKQKSSDKLWKDEAGTSIPYDRTTKFERAAEVSLFKLATEASKLHYGLTSFKENFIAEAERLYELFVKENGQLGKGKGSATFYNFDRSIKIMVKVNSIIVFDENTIQLAKDKLDEFLRVGLDGAKDYMKPLVMDAFNRQNGKLDTKKVLGLRRYTSRINQPLYTEAMGLIDKAIRRPGTREYYQVWVRNERGEYEDIQLNFASI
ncbi:DUF3164 family protein [Litoribacter populi]|uniref:DUF3164 family protein n=1 Tax=Litoribacter populi TaxID=2598460 RepID=UPI0011807E8B|nr:DUF3164 family protein [Litoribacter populi]